MFLMIYLDQGGCFHYELSKKLQAFFQLIIVYGFNFIKKIDC